jgi:hypothetical protein
MNINNVLLTTLALIGCNSEKTDTDYINHNPYDNCGGVYDFDIEEDINAGRLQALLNDSSSLESVTCEMLCLQYEGDATGFDTCEYELDFDALPEDFDTWDANEIVGTLQCSGVGEMLCEGRRPVGYVEVGTQYSNIGGRFAHTAQLEAASIIAFIELAQQLEAWDAPKGLIHRCLLAAKDEVHHARAFMRLAKKFNATIPPIQQEVSAQDLLSIAIHNAVEGCVFETWAALKSHHQAAHCEIPELQKLYKQVAIDETRHGQLAWDLHTWFMKQLNKTDQQLVIAAQAKAFERLRYVAAAESETPFLGNLHREDAIRMAIAFTEKLSA